MAEATYRKDEHIFDQGDEGDAFFVLIHGAALVLRDDGGGSEPKVLAQLADGAIFGERALLRNDTRYATVKVTSAELLAMVLSRRDFEAQRFHELVPDKYR